MSKLGWVSFIIGVGVALAGSALGVIASVWPEIIKPHPYWVVFLLSSGAILVISPLLGLLYSRDESSASRTDGPSNNAGRDIGGSQFRDGNLFLGDEVAKVALGRSPVPHKEDSPAKLPTITFEHVETQNLTYLEHKGLWAISDQQGQNTVLAKVWYPFPENQVAPSPGIQVSAILRFKERGGAYTQVDNAYWVGRSPREITLRVGEHGLILLGAPDAKQWVTYNNPYRTPLASRRGARRTRGGRVRVSGPCDGIEIELSVVDKQSGFRLGFQRYRVAHTNADHYEVEMLAPEPKQRLL